MIRKIQNSNPTSDQKRETSVSDKIRNVNLKFKILSSFFKLGSSLFSKESRAAGKLGTDRREVFLTTVKQSQTAGVWVASPRRMMTSLSSSGSALLLTVVVISVITTTTLGAVALTYNQLASTDKVNNSGSAKLAAESGLSRLKETIWQSDAAYPKGFNLSDNQEISSLPASLASFRPSPRDSVYTIESSTAVDDLPRCLAVGVLSPWVNSGEYLFREASPENPALIFNYANIVSDTPLGVIAANVDDQTLNEETKKLPISELTKLGHFYNPYASPDKNPSDPDYWTIKLGGPNDQFLTKLASDGQSSFYQNLDFVYAPFLPRWRDSGLLSLPSGLERKTAGELQAKFESVIRQNNFKLWLDGAASNDLIYQYGLGDLFTNPADDKYRVSWLQPSLWNDLPEADNQTGYYRSGLMGPFVSSNAAGNPVTWESKPPPINQSPAAGGDWRLMILRASRSFAFAYPSGDLTRTLNQGGEIDLNFYGSYEGLRLNQPLTLVLIDKKTSQPLNLEHRDSVNQGQFFQATLTKIDTGSHALKIKFAANNSLAGIYNTPNKKVDGLTVKLEDLAAIYLQTGVLPSTEQSLSSRSLSYDSVSQESRVNGASSTCPSGLDGYLVCPAVGDLVGLSRPADASAPLWGVVKQVKFDPNGTAVTELILDSFRQGPKPLQDIAHVRFTDLLDSNKEKIAYYGGRIVANEFDGGLASVSDELWFYTPSENKWEFLGRGPANGPGPRAGGSLTYSKQADNERLVLFGGYRYEGIGQLGLGKTCGDNYYLSSCLYANRPQARIGKVFPNDLTMFNLKDPRGWSTVSLSEDNTANPNIADNSSLELRVASRFSERSGKDDWPMRASVAINSSLNLSTNPNDTATLTITPSIAGLAYGDILTLSGITTTNNEPFIASARVVDLYSSPSQQIKVKVYATTSGSVTLRSLSLKVVNHLQTNAQCVWDNGDKFCTVGNAAGLAVGDAVTLEQYDNYANPMEITAVYAGYISRLVKSGNNWQVYFVSEEKLGCLNDFAADDICADESVRLRPLGRANGYLAEVGNNQDSYLWQGSQTDELSSGRLADLWAFQWNQTKWTSIENDLPALADNLTVQTIDLPSAATIFTSPTVSNNPQTISCEGNPKTVNRSLTTPELVPDKCQKRVREVNNQQITDYVFVWDKDKTWTIELNNEGNDAWTTERLTSNTPITIERTKTENNQQSREVFNGLITEVDLVTDPIKPKIKIKHTGGEDSGLSDNSANARITLHYPARRNTNALSVSSMIKTDNDKIRGNNVGELSALPVGASVLVYPSNANFTSGSSDKFMIGQVERRETITDGPNLTGFKFSAAGPRYLPGPIASIMSNNALISNAGQPRAYSTGQFRLKNVVWTAEWWSDLKSNPGWQVQFSRAAGADRPAPRQGGASAVNSSGEQAYLTGGTIGEFADLWRVNKVNNPEDSNNAWSLAKASFKSSDDLPNLRGMSLDWISGDKLVAFGGKRFVNSRSPVGPRVLGASADDGDFDGSFYLDLDENSSLRAADFLKLTYQQNPNPPPNVNRDSFKLSGSASNDLCRYLGEGDCQQQSLRHLGTLGRFGLTAGDSLAVINPGSLFRYEGGQATDKRSLILSGPSRSLPSTNNRWDAEGYQPFACDIDSNNGCISLSTYGNLTAGNETTLANDKALLLAGFTNLDQGGSLLVTPAGAGLGITSGPLDKSYCGAERADGNYDCDKNLVGGRYLNHRPDSEDLLFLFNAAKVLASQRAYKVTGYYGGVRRGFLVNTRQASPTGDYLEVKEIVP